MYSNDLGSIRSFDGGQVLCSHSLALCFTRRCALNVYHRKIADPFGHAGQALGYLAFRPTYPRTLLERIGVAIGHSEASALPFITEASALPVITDLLFLFQLLTLASRA
jgi:hypothetical protein